MPIKTIKKKDNKKNDDDLEDKPEEGDPDDLRLF